MKKDEPTAVALSALLSVLDRRPRIFRDLADAEDFAAYLDNGARQDDEELLTEGILQEIIERVLGFPPDAYFPQLSKSGLKPDFTPMDLIAHPFVLDAKSSRQRLADHEAQIRTYIDQRHLDFGVLFNLAELRVYRRTTEGHDPSLSFSLLPLWRLGRGEVQPGPDLEAFARFLALFSYKQVDLDAKIEAIREAAPWEERGKGDELRVDIDLLVEQLRRLSRLLADDAENQPEAMDTHIKLNPGFEERLLAELAAIAQDIQPSTDEESLPSSVAVYRTGERFEQRVWRQYSLRVAQLTLARILLYRAWEDAGFIREQLYDGGFRDVYEELGEKAREVLKSAFAAGAQRYHWLFERQTTYDWYAPREDQLVEVLYSFTQFPLDRLDADVLGGLYESYVDEIDRDRLGQFYTPREVVRLMLDRAGFRGSENVMRLEGDERVPVKSFDFASGSGGFDVEIARRLIDDSGALTGDADLQLDALSAIARGIHAIEISPFPYYLTEINLLLQVSRLLGALAHEGREVPSFVLSVVHEDALQAKPTAAASLEGLAPEQRADHALLKPDRRFGLTGILDPEKQTAFDRIRAGGFDLIVGNPPYVAEANNRPLFERLRQIDAWKGIYRGKSDYLYYFLFMAAELLAPGGRLCVIVPAGWMNAGNADWLRDKLAASLRLDELFLFGSYRLFAPTEEARTRRRRAPTPTVESAILLATKAEAGGSHKLRVTALEDEALAAEALNGNSEEKVPERAALLAEMVKRADGRQGRRAGIHVHDVKQSDLVADRPWPVKHGAKDAGSRVVARMERQLGRPGKAIEQLGVRWSIPQGVQTGADAYTRRIQTRLRNSFPDALKQLENAGAELGAPILELPAGREKDAPWQDHPEVLARSIEPGAILYAALDEDDYTSLVWLGHSDEPPQEVIAELERWRPVLANRAEINRNRSRRWWECAWTRDRELLRRPKVIALYRTDRGRFAIDDDGSWQPSIKTTLVIPRGDDLSVTYLGGLLNSELLDLWYAIRGKAPRDVWRNYEPKRMKEIPYRNVDLASAGRGKRAATIEKALDDGKTERTVALAEEVAADLRAAGDSALTADAPEAVEAAHVLEVIVRGIADNRRALLPYRDRFPALSRVVKDPWSTGPVDPVPNAFVEALPKTQRVSVRVDPELEPTIETDGALGKPVYEHGLLTFAYRRKVVAKITGPAPKLMLLAELLAEREKPMPADLLAAEVPCDVDRFRTDVESTQADVARLLSGGRSLVEAAERLVCALYAVPLELEHEVVAHAVARAKVAAGSSA
jgi:Eco57I restriction-modification methylase